MVLDRLITIERSAIASPWRGAGVRWCRPDMIIGCTLPSVTPSNIASNAITHGLMANG
jgi:hypothetical protein